jgi:hypothetical protein
LVAISESLSNLAISVRAHTETASERHTKLWEERDFRPEWAEKIGLGFEYRPQFWQVVPRIVSRGVADCDVAENEEAPDGGKAAKHILHAALSGSCRLLRIAVQVTGPAGAANDQFRRVLLSDLLLRSIARSCDNPGADSNDQRYERKDGYVDRFNRKTRFRRHVPVDSVVLSDGDPALQLSEMKHTYRVSLYLRYRECPTNFAGTDDVSDSLFLHGPAVGENT